MARQVFVPEYVDKGWFDHTASVEGWFDSDLAPTSGGVAADGSGSITLGGTVGGAGAATASGSITLGGTATAVGHDGPFVFSVGVENSGTGNVTYALPAHQADDILLLVVECSETAGVTAPSGWAHVTNSPRAQGSNVTTANVLWKRATSGAETDPTVTDPGNHQVGFATVIRGAVTSGDPWDFTPVGDGGAGATSFSADTGTTTVADTLVCTVVVNNQDTLTDQFSSVSMSGVTNFTEVGQAFTDNGNGGGVALYTGELSTATTPGTCDGTIGASSSWSALTFALKPPTGGMAADGSGSITLSGSAGAAAATSASGTLTLAATGAVQAVTSASGSITLAATSAASGAVTGSGSVTLAGTVTARGAASASGSVTLDGTATPGGPTAAGSVTLTGTATGQAPTTATGTVTLAGSVTARAATTASGTVTLDGTAVARAPVTASGTVTLTATGVASAAVTATGTITLTGTGEAHPTTPGFATTIYPATITVTATAPAAAYATATRPTAAAATGRQVTAADATDIYPTGTTVTELLHV